MAFRFSNPLRQVANAQTSINRGLGQFGQVSSALQNFNDIQRNIGRVSSSISQISSNAESLSGTITSISSAGDILNSLGGNSSLSNTIRSVSSLTRDVQTLLPGNTRVGSQAATLSRRAEDLFANTQRNIQGIQSISGGINDVLNGTLDVGNLANRSLGSITGGLNLGSIVGSSNLGSVSTSVQSAISRITSSAPELQNIVNNPISVVPRSVAQLTGAIGERYDGLRQAYDTLSSSNSFINYVDSTFSPLGQSTAIPQSQLGQFADLPAHSFAGAEMGAGQAYSKIPNPLRNYSSFNYIITLGILSAEEYNNPNSYRSTGGFENYVIRSGGGDYAKRYQTDQELNNQNPGHAEYFIDNFEMDAVIAPNPNTNVALGTALTFTVSEPYSMGNFIEAIIGAAATANFKNYLDAPFCIRIDFVGWDEFGVANKTVTQPIFIPIKLTKIDFSVDGKGSTYEVKAVPMSEAGLSDDVNEIKTPINAAGDFLHTVLETGARSVTGIMNDRVSRLEDTGVIAPYDRYVIVFPKSREALTDYLKQDIINPDALTIDVRERVLERVGGEFTLENATETGRLTEQYAEINQNIRANISSVGKMFAKLKTFAEEEGEMNEIGLSVLVEDTATGGNQPQGSQSGSTGPDDGSRGQAARNAPETAPAEKSRDYQFNQGMRITETIERMVLNSAYARERATEPAQNGIRKWFKIDTLTFIEENPETEAQIGRPPKVYVFSIIPYDADEAKFNAPNERPANTEGLKAAAAKEYNYIYTGKNEDVLNFDLKFNNAFMQTAFSNFGQNSAAAASGTSQSLVQRDVSTGSSTSQQTGAGNQSTTGQVGESAANVTGAGYSNAVGDGDIRRRIAEQFHDRIINQTVDMVTAEMEIIGDPFFIPQEMGNFAARQGDRPNTTEEGTMAYQGSEVFAVVNFRTPFDYQVNGATIEFPKVVPKFSGLFSIWAVTNSLSGGKFTQTLKMIRRRGQDDPATDNNLGAVQENPETDITSEAGSNSDSQTGNSGANTSSGSSYDEVPTTPNRVITSTNPPAAVVRNPTDVRFGSIDQATNAARAYAQANPGFTYAIRPGTNGGFTVANRPADSAPVATDLSARVEQTARQSTSANQPRSPAC